MTEQNPNNKQPAFDLEALRLQTLEELEHALPVPEVKNTYSYAELHAEKDIEQKFLIPELIPANAVTMFIGEDGIGKTQLIAQLCAHICCGFTEFVGLNLYAEKKSCLYVATEDSKQKFTQAFVKQMRHLDPEHNPKEIKLYFTEGSNFDDLAGLKNELESHLRRHPADLVSVDAFGDLFGLIDGEINSNSHARRLLSMLQQVCNTFQTTIIIIHHAAKTKIVEKRKHGKMFVEKTDSQGAGAITQKPRTVLALTHDPKTINADGSAYTNYLHVVKANLMGKVYEKQAIELQFTTTTLLHRRTGLVDIELMQAETQEQAAGADQPTKTNGKHKQEPKNKSQPFGPGWKPIPEARQLPREREEEEDIGF